MIGRSFFALTLLLLCLGGHEAAASTEIAVNANRSNDVNIPSYLPGINMVNADEVLTAIMIGNILLIDARTPSNYLMGTIPTAQSCPVPFGAPTLHSAEIKKVQQKMAGCSAIAQLHPAKAPPIIVFCNGSHCWRSAKAVLALKRMGFERVQWFRDGISLWRQQQRPMM
uniref:Rhodanese domain-containing protein n=1 Tax=Magnetococcus massalia (strain MO-1) TaxID=451514 RepID=A0A1S7LJD0_MAGMO|nr:conserved protein of unknown function [include a single copy of rhodanese domain] [Candidatus Magnetococcus massalia]